MRRLVQFGPVIKRAVTLTLLVIAILFLVGLLGVTGAVGYRIAWVPQWALTEGRGTAAVLSYRSTMAPILQALVQITAGLVVATGAVVAWLQLSAVRRGQLAEREARALQALESEREELRVGAVMALERIANESGTDGQLTVVGVLSALVRSRSQQRTAGQLRPSRDVENALFAISRIVGASSSLKPDLVGADLRGAQLAGIVLSNAILTGANLEASDLSGALLRYVDLSRATLVGANLRSARMRGATLTAADAQSCDFRQAHIAFSDLTYSDLRSARFDSVRLENVLLARSDARQASFRDADVIMTTFQFVDCRGSDLTVKEPMFIFGVFPPLFDAETKIEDKFRAGGSSGGSFPPAGPGAM